MNRLSTVEDLCRSNCSPGGGKRFSDEIYIQVWIARVKARSIVDANGCWLWQGFVFKNGYGTTSYRGKSGRLHRYAFEVFKGPVPAGHDVCHSCDVRNCWNPDHLWSGTRKENLLDMLVKGRHWTRKTNACINGHEYTPENTRVSERGWRVCRTCERAHAREYWADGRAKARQQRSRERARLRKLALQTDEEKSRG